MGIEASLFKIADALRIDLLYSNGTCVGHAKATYSPVPGLDMPVHIRTKKTFVGTTPEGDVSVGVVVHVLGNMHIMVGHFQKTGMVTAYVVDGDELRRDGQPVGPGDLLDKKNTLSEAVRALRAGIRKAFIWKDRKWSPLQLPT